MVIIDAVERPELIEAVIAGTIHHIRCPNGHDAATDSPLLIYQPGHPTPLTFSPPEATTAEEDEQIANGLVTLPANSLGEEWQDEWLEDVVFDSRALLEAELSGDPDAIAAALAEAVPPGSAEVLEEIATLLAEEGITLESEDHLEQVLAARPDPQAKLLAAVQEVEDDSPEEDDIPEMLYRLQDFMQATTWIDSYRYLVAYPELLSNQADELMERTTQCATRADNDEAARSLAEHRDLLLCSRANGALVAFAEHLGVTPELFTATVERTQPTDDPVGASR